MPRTYAGSYDKAAIHGVISLAQTWRPALRSDPVLFALAALIAVSVVGYGTGAGSFTLQVVLVWLVMTCLHGGLVVLAWRVRTMVVDGPGIRRMWTGIAAAGAVFCLGDIDQLALIAAGPITVALSLGAAFQAVCALAGSAVIVVAALFVPIGLRTRSDRARYRLDLAIVLTGTAGACAYTYVPPPADGTPALLGVLIGPGVFMLGIFAMVRLVLAAEPPFTTWAGIAAGCAAAAEATAFATSTLLIERGLLSWVFGLNVIGSSLLTVSARIQQRQILGSISFRRNRRRYSLAPYGAVAITYGLLCWGVADLHPSMQVWIIVISAVAATGLVVVRQLAAFAENARLLEELDGRVEQLHQSLSERDRLAARLRHQAFHDPLTELGNRALLTERLERELAAERSPEQTMALIVLDLDGFKQVNDVFGHVAGDELLVAAAERLRSDVGDRALVARLGGDEFAILVVDTAEDVERLADRLVATMAEPFPLSTGAVAKVSASLGMVVCHGSGYNCEQLLEEADVAMYEAKHAGKCRFRLRTL
ncbi:MAG TPA: GGDEF domain-containing protein [Kineosporiaceae bacterium]|nr:GGDEF domain-containing protein [Kineosporiaceae bacterium]